MPNGHRTIGLEQIARGALAVSREVFRATGYTIRNTFRVADAVARHAPGAAAALGFVTGITGGYQIADGLDLVGDFDDAYEAGKIAIGTMLFAAGTELARRAYK